MTTTPHRASAWACPNCPRPTTRPTSSPARGGRAEIIARYPESRSALLPLLHLVQSEEGYVTRTGIRFCAEMLGLTTAEVTAVATFYTMYRRKPSGDYQVGVCTNTLCAVMGGDAIFETLQEHLGVGNDETTEDGKVTLEHIECNAACDFAPVVMVNWEFFDNQTPERARSSWSTTCARAAGRAQPRRARCARTRRPRGSSRASPTGAPAPSRRPAARDPPRWSACASPRGAAAAARVVAPRDGGPPTSRRQRGAARDVARRAPQFARRATETSYSDCPPRGTRRRGGGVMTLAPSSTRTSPEKLLSPVLSAFWDEAESWTLDIYRRHEGYEGLRKALAMSPDDLIAYVNLWRG